MTLLEAVLDAFLIDHEEAGMARWPLPATHGHRCHCGHYWRHRASDFRSQEEYERGHMCAECGAPQYVKCD